LPFSHELVLYSVAHTVRDKKVFLLEILAGTDGYSLRNKLHVERVDSDILISGSAV